MPKCKSIIFVLNITLRIFQHSCAAWNVPVLRRNSWPHVLEMRPILLFDRLPNDRLGKSCANLQRYAVSIYMYYVHFKMIIDFRSVNSLPQPNIFQQGQQGQLIDQPMNKVSSPMRLRRIVSSRDQDRKMDTVRSQRRSTATVRKRSSRPTAKIRDPQQGAMHLNRMPTKHNHHRIGFKTDTRNKAMRTQSHQRFSRTGRRLQMPLTPLGT